MQDLTQEKLAAIVGVRRETIMRSEAGKYNPSLKNSAFNSEEKLVTLSDAFEIEIANLSYNELVDEFTRFAIE